MNRERSLKVVRNHVPVRVPPGAAEAGLGYTIAVVLSTFRSDATEMVLDHELWLACMGAVERAVGATTAVVYTKAPRRFLERLRRPRLGLAAGSLVEYGARLLADPDREKIETDVWDVILWRREGRLVAAATCEPWYAVGGPDHYHDSYTTSIQVGLAHHDALAGAIETDARAAGGWVEDLVPRL
jgi:hypothetical protein